jgi:hypothetical protein
MKNFLISSTLALFVGSFIAFGQQTLPPNIIKLKGATDNTPIGNVSDSLKVDVTNALPQPSPPANQNVTIINPSPVPVEVSNPTAFPTPYPVQDVQINSTLVPFPTPYAPFSGPFPTPPALQDVQINSTLVPFPTPYAPFSGPFPTPYPNQSVTVTGQPISVTGPFPTPPPTQTVTGTVTANQGAPGASPWPMTVSNPTAFPTPYPVQDVQINSTLVPFPTPYSGPFPTPYPNQSVTITGQPISVTGAFPTPAPTPTNYALETGGNLANIVSNQGTSGSGITQPTGGAGMLGWLSGIYKALINTLNVAVLSNVAPPDFYASATLTAQCTSPGSCPANSTVTISNPSALGNAVLEIQGTWVGTIIVEGSNDAGLTWNPRSIIQTSPAQLASTGVSADGYYRVTGVGGYRILRARMTVYSSGSALVYLNASVGTDVTGTINTNPNNLLMSEGAANAIVSYSACATDLTISATPTDIFTLTGSATKVVTIMRVEISGTEAVVSMHEFDLVVRSSANSGGTFTNPTAVPHDPNDAAATAVATAYTASPTTLGTTVGTLWSKKFVIPATTGVDSSWPQVFDFGQYSQGEILRGTANQLAVTTDNLALSSSSLNICVRWTEQ